MREFIDGATAIVRGALAAGCNFFAGYPITPATPILLQMLRELPKTGGIAIQGEDEIASIGMCIGAALAGRLPLTATSGPGISLYSENIGLAIMAEVPLVIIDVQRLGPATGGATTVGQGDVQFVRWGTGGGYPLIVLAPSSVAECMTLTMEAFALAQRFRCPVIVLTDKELNLTRATMEVLEPPAHLPTPEPLIPVSPPFGSGEVVRITGSTHDDRGRITKDPVAVEALNRHLLSKVLDHRDEIEQLRTDLQSGADTLLVTFGTTARTMEAALPLIRQKGKRTSSVVVQSLWPIPEHGLRQAAAGVKRIIVGELNPGLYVRELQQLLPDRDIVSLHRINGQMITPEDFITAVDAEG